MQIVYLFIYLFGRHELKSNFPTASIVDR